MIRIRDQYLDIDIREELEQFDWHKVRWTSDKLLAASPFRNDRHPSFFVNLDGEYVGTWGDSGADDDYYSSGNLVKLLAYLRGTSYEEVEEYLLDKYGQTGDSNVIVIRPPRFHLRSTFRPLDENIVTPAISPYLLKRGVSEEVQRMAGVGFGRYKGFTAIPWRRANGVLANVMYRSTRGKTFFYEQGGWPIGRLLWGIDIVHAERAREVVICEAPIDAMSWMTAGINAVALGGVILSDEQADIIRRSPIDTIILGGDNDRAGEQLNAEVKRKMGGMYRYRAVDFERHKDANDVLNAEGIEGLVRTVSEYEENSLQLCKITVI